MIPHKFSSSRNSPSTRKKTKNVNKKKAKRKFPGHYNLLPC